MRWALGGILGTVKELLQLCLLQGWKWIPQSFLAYVQCVKMTLKLSFPELYPIAYNKDALVSDYLGSSDNYIHWNWRFIKAVQDWEFESLHLFLNLLYSSKTHPRELDKILWTPTCNKGFEVKRYYISLFPGEPYYSHVNAFGRLRPHPALLF